MSDFLITMAPAVFFFTLPLAPLAYTGILATVEIIVERTTRRGGPHVASSVLQVTAEYRQSTDTARSHQRAA